MLNRRQLAGGAARLGLMGGAGVALPLISRADDAGKTLNDRLTGDLSPVHDPSIIQDRSGGYHLFTTSQKGERAGLIHWRTSPDLVTWTFKGAVMPDFPAWVLNAVPQARGAWAPDISYVGGRYLLYYAVSTFGSNHSVIGLMTTPTLDTADPAFGWADEGLVISSDKGNDYNAIDPNHVIDADGRHWLAFGSFWSGIKLIELDPQTHKPKDAKAKPKAIAGRASPGAIEGAVILPRGGFYYLFASYDFCCRGVNSSYYTCVGRSKAIDGPYADSGGLAMLKDGGTLVLDARMDKTGRFKGPGGASILHCGDKDIIVYHAYDGDKNGMPTLRMQVLDWSADGWPVAV